MQSSLLRRHIHAICFLACALCLRTHASDSTTISGPHASTDLVLSTFNTTLQVLHPSAWAVIELYASWCPHCIHFAPEYDKIARFMLTKNIGGHPVFVGRADCQFELQLCGMFSPDGYPSIMLGTVGDFITLQLPRLARFTPHPVRDAASIVQWIGNVSHSNLTYVAEHEALRLPSDIIAASELPHIAKVWDLQDVESATVQLFRIITESPLLHTGAKKRLALESLVTLWASAHPSTRCRQSAQQLLAQYAEAWPASQAVAPATLLGHAICGRPAPAVAWSACQGTQPHTRGFTCGLWLLMHTTSVRLSDRDADRPGAMYMRALRAFNEHFFQCSACRQHFGDMLSRPHALRVTTRAQAVLWTWRAHNEVNARLSSAGGPAQSSDGATTDQAFPKVQWPIHAACPSCRLTRLLSAEGEAATGDWNHDEVVAYMSRAYGEAAANRGPHGSRLQQLYGAGAGRSSSTSHSARPSLVALSVIPMAVIFFALVYWAACQSSKTRHGPARSRGPAGPAYGVDLPK